MDTRKRTEMGADTERNDAQSLIRLVHAYRTKHPESTLVFGLRLSGSDRMKIVDEGDPDTRAQMAHQLGTRAVAAYQQEQRSKIAAAGELSPGEITDLLVSARKRGMQGG